MPPPPRLYTDILYPPLAPRQSTDFTLDGLLWVGADAEGETPPAATGGSRRREPRAASFFISGGGGGAASHARSLAARRSFLPCGPRHTVRAGKAGPTPAPLSSDLIPHEQSLPNPVSKCSSSNPVILSSGRGGALFDEDDSTDTDQPPRRRVA